MIDFRLAEVRLQSTVLKNNFLNVFLVYIGSCQTIKVRSSNKELFISPHLYRITAQYITIEFVSRSLNNRKRNIKTNFFCSHSVCIEKFVIYF